MAAAFFTVAALASGIVAVDAAPAKAAVSCSAWASSDRHTGYAYCSSTQPTTGTFRVAAYFCSSSGSCNWAYGPWKFIGGGENSTVNRSTWINGSPAQVKAEQGPAGGVVPVG